MLCSAASICQPQADTVSNLQQDIMDLNEDYLDAVGQGNANKAKIILAEIQEKAKELHAARLALEKCIATNGLQPLTATFTAPAVVATTIKDPQGSSVGGTTPSIPIALRFDAVRFTVTITNFPEQTIKNLPTPWGPDTLTVDLSTGIGTFSCSSGEMSIPVVFSFTNSVDPLSPFVSPTDTVSMTLNTGPNTSNSLTVNGSPMDNQGNMTLAGIGTFSGGEIATLLGQQEIAITLQGSVSPLP